MPPPRFSVVFYAIDLEQPLASAASQASSQIHINPFYRDGCRTTHFSHGYAHIKGASAKGEGATSVSINIVARRQNSIHFINSCHAGTS